MSGVLPIVHYVYELYTLLGPARYIGITDDPAIRLAMHRSHPHSPWIDYWFELAHKRGERVRMRLLATCRTWHDSYATERQAILQDLTGLLNSECGEGARLDTLAAERALELGALERMLAASLGSSVSDR